MLAAAGPGPQAHARPSRAPVAIDAGAVADIAEVANEARHAHVARPLSALPACRAGEGRRREGGGGQAARDGQCAAANARCLQVSRCSAAEICRGMPIPRLTCTSCSWAPGSAGSGRCGASFGTLPRRCGNAWTCRRHTVCSCARCMPGNCRSAAKSPPCSSGKGRQRRSTPLCSPLSSMPAWGRRAGLQAGPPLKARSSQPHCHSLPAVDRTAPHTHMQRRQVHWPATLAVSAQKLSRQGAGGGGGEGGAGAWHSPLAPLGRKPALHGRGDAVAYGLCIHARCRRTSRHSSFPGTGPGSRQGQCTAAS